MEDTLLEVDHGAALAANQIGIKLRMFAVNQLMTAKSDDLTVRAIPPIVINPVILEHSKEKIIDTEGCLSFPNFSMKLPRWKDVKVKYETILHWGGPQPRVHETVEATYSGFWARMFQHEIDHLDGKLFVDMLPIGKRLQIAKKMGGRR